jgi:hypothetical protein
MSELVFFLEEPSAKAMLNGLLPRLLPQTIPYRCVVFEGKQDLEKQIVRKMRGYRVPGAKFIVLRDMDSGGCNTVKRTLVAKCREAGKPDAIVRIACHELESWYCADLAAIEKGLGITGLTRFQNKLEFANPDHYPSPSKILLRIAPSYQKIGGSRAIGPYLDVTNCRSNSFRVFIEAIKRACDQ